MSRKMEYELKGKSDVDQVVGRAKASLSQMQQFTNAVSKKLSEFGKDFALSYFAPVMLLNRAIDFIGRKIEERRAQIKEALDMASEAEDFSQFDPTTVFLAKRFKAEDDAKKKRLQMEDAAAETTQRFIEQDKRAAKIPEVEAAMLMAAATKNLSYLSSLGRDKDVQRAVAAILQSDAGVSIKKKVAEDMTKAQSVSGNVIGVGQSPVIAAMTETNDLLRSIDNKLTPAQPPLTPDPNLTNKATAPSRAGLLMGR